MATNSGELELAVEAISSQETTPNQHVLELHDGHDDDDESSIEALNWSDFDEEEMEIAKQLAEKEFPSSSSLPILEKITQDSTAIEVNEEEITGKDDENDEDESKGSEENSPNSVLSMSTSQILKDDDDPPEILDLNSLNNVIEDYEEVNAELETEPLIAISSLSSDSPNLGAVCHEDQISNDPVLDDGPIWAKGDKKYKFHENQRINQKLTFGVLLAVVLAVGIGLGNLVAYNEYEAENNKPIDSVHCSSPGRSFPVDTSYENNMENPNDLPIPAEFPSSTHIKHKRYTYNAAQDPIREGGAVESLGADANTFAYVVKSIDELSKKIDQFQNTTRQLSGIIVMREDSNNRFTKLPAKPIQIVDEALLPQLSDEILGWESSGERQAKFSDVIVDDTEEVIDTPSETDTSEYVQAALPTVSNIKPEGLLTIQPSKVKRSIQNENKQDFENPLSNKNAKNKKPLDENLPQKRQKKQKKSKGERGSLNPGHETGFDQRQSLDNRDSKKIHKRQNSRGKRDREATLQNTSESNYYKLEKSVLSEEKQKAKLEKSQKESVAEYQNQIKEEDTQGSSLIRDFTENEMKQDTLTEECDKKCKNQKKAKKSDKSRASDADKINKVKRSGSNKEFDSDGNTKDSKLYGNDHAKWVNKRRKYSEQKENNFILYESSNEGEIITNKKDYKKKKDDAKQRVLPKYKERRQREEKKAEKVNWEANRAELREKQRVYQNWESDFNTNDHSKSRRKRNQNWQIERDHTREKIRKTEN